jgi:hypothetical protein
MDHILTKCKADPIKLIWDLAKEMWPHNPTLWPEISLGIILSSRCLVTPEAQEEDNIRNILRMKSGTDRLL